MLTYITKVEPKLPFHKACIDSVESSLCKPKLYFSDKAAILALQQDGYAH